MSKYFAKVQPTYLEAWPSALARLSIAQVDIPLTLEDAAVLGRNIAELGEGFVSPGRGWKDEYEADAPARAALVRRLDEALTVFAHSGFVRLGSRSPKDAWNSKPNVENCDQALDRLCDCSIRVYEDLKLALSVGYCPHIFVRQWIEIPEWAEFRCFMKDRKLQAISQYNYLHDAVYPEIKEHADSIQWAIDRWSHDFRSACHIDTVIFDVFVKLRKIGNETQTQVKLLEINPYFEMTDPCLFDWRHPELISGFKYNGQG